MLKTPKTHEIIIIGFLLIFYFFLLAQPINLSTADLGRHIKNGEFFLQKFQIPKTNLYSYTYPDQSFINHHWGSGVIFYLVHGIFGFTGISIFFIILSLATFTFFLHAAWARKNFWSTAILAVVALPVIASRVEIRPEVFSYFLAGIFFWILWNYQQDKISKKIIYWLPVLTILWVNLHIYFFLGGVLVLIFLLENLWQKFIYGNRGAVLKIKQHPYKLQFVRMLLIDKNLGLVLLLMGVAVLINPNGLTGALYPLNIFKDYGYRLFENQSVFFIENLFAYPPALYFKLLFGISFLSWVFVIFRVANKKTKFNLGLFLLWVFFSYLGWRAVRNFTLFGYFAFVVSSINFTELAEIKISSRYKKYAPAFIFVFIVAVVASINPSFWKARQNISFGLQKGVMDAANYFKKNGLRGPVFNNYDVGGYLIYNLYPQEKVFVDNRPETYPASFFKETYIPMQENEERWQEMDKKYNFRTIFFWRNDLTPWGQKFIAKRANDPSWSLVFADNYHLIFVRSSPND